ncbi:MAG TPA: erythromycin esterase family protein [Gemmatimonadales bacterium]
MRWGTRPFAFEAPAAGLYVLELSVPALPQVPLEANPSFRVQVHEWASAGMQAARREDLRRDPRTAWLRAHAASIRSVEPEDDDFSDLEFLRRDLRGVRVVLLGEENHGAGSTFKAKTRLIKFLHQEMGFNVLAFESGIFSMREAWRALQSATELREAFANGAFSVWARSAQLQPLIDYLAQQARTDRPLELVGVDHQFSGTAAPSFPQAVRALLREYAIESPLAQEASVPSQVLTGILDGRFARDRDHLPSESEQEATMQSLRAAAAQVERRVPGPDGALWGQILRSAAATVRLYLGGLLSEGGSFEGRDRQMAENLIWLANEHYRGEKLIVWAANVHVMRNPGVVSPDLMRGLSGNVECCDFTMGHGISEVLEREAFAVGFTSYRGRTHMANLPDEIEQEIVSDQRSAFEFEELMDAAGHELAFVNLRDLPERDTWLSGEFWARPLDLRMSDSAPWSQVFDALFFIRAQEPSRRAR